MTAYIVDSFRLGKVARACLLVVMGIPALVPAEPAAATPLALQPLAAVQPAQGPPLRASTILESSVVDARQREVGEVEDIVLDLESGRINYVAMTLPEIAGPGRIHVLPISALRMPRNPSGAVAVIYGEDVLARLRSFPQDNWPGLQEAGYWENLANEIPALPGLPDQPKQAVRISKLIGEDVRNVQGEQLGQVRDVIIGQGRALYAVLEYDGGLFHRSKLFAYPLHSFSIPADARGESGRMQFIELDVERGQLDLLKGLSHEDLPPDT